MKASFTRTVLLAASLIALPALALADNAEGYVPARDAIPLAPDLRGEAAEAAPPAAPIAAAADAGPTVEKEAVELPPPGQPVGEGDAIVRVQVLGQAEGRYDAPLSGQGVELSVIRPPHQVIERLIAVTGDDGTAEFRAAPGPGLQAFARTFQTERETFAPTGVSLTEAGERSLTIQDIPIVQDPSVIFAPRIVTIVELWEDYIVFTQIFSLATDQPVVFEAAAGGRDSGFRIPLPDGAAGVRIVQPADKAESMGDAIMFRGQILPAGEASEAPTLIVRYSIRHDNTSKVNWSQEFPFDVVNLSLVVPQTSQHDKHPRLNVDIDVPLCDEGNAPAGVMCFAEYSDTAEGVQMLQGAAVRLARGGRVASGGRMDVLTTGWPSDPHIARWAGGAAVLLAALVGFLLFRRSRTASAAKVDGYERLMREKEAILQRVDQLEQQLADAAILEMDYEAEREQIIGELALVERRIRSFDASGTHG